MDQKNSVKIEYTNWKGVKSTRHIVPLKLWFGHTQWHPHDQWLLKAHDLDKDAPRDFALKDIEAWQENTSN